MACEHNNSIKCSCPSKICERHGKCCECVVYHRDVKGDPPSCLRK